MELSKSCLFLGMPSNYSTEAQEVYPSPIKTQALIIMFSNSTHLIIVGIFTAIS